MRSCLYRGAPLGSVGCSSSQHRRTPELVRQNTRILPVHRLFGNVGTKAMSSCSDCGKQELVLQKSLSDQTQIVAHLSLDITTN